MTIRKNRKHWSGQGSVVNSGDELYKIKKKENRLRKTLAS